MWGLGVGIGVSTLLPSVGKTGKTNWSIKCSKLLIDALVNGISSPQHLWLYTFLIDF